MNEIKIGENLERNQQKKEVKEVEKLISQEFKSNDGKSMLIILIVVISIFAFSLGGFKMYDKLTAATIAEESSDNTPNAVDYLHKQNIKGKLDEDQGYMYQGNSFVKYDGLWWTILDRGDKLVKIPLHYGPKEVNQIEVIGQLSKNFNKKEEIYIAINPTINQNKYYTLSLMELNNNIVQGINRKIISACTEKNEICEDRLILNCNDSKGKAVIEIIPTEEKPTIELIDSCIKITGSAENLTKATDKLLYSWYGIN